MGRMEWFYDEMEEDEVDNDKINKNMDIEPWCFEVDHDGNYIIYQSKTERKNVHKINVKQNAEGFSWSMFKTGKRIKTHYNKHDYHGGFWWICNPEEVDKDIHEWFNKNKLLNERKKQKLKFQKKGKIK